MCPGETWRQRQLVNAHFLCQLLTISIYYSARVLHIILQFHGAREEKQIPQHSWKQSLQLKVRTARVV